jgi:hypothetical protein
MLNNLAGMGAEAFFFSRLGALFSFKNFFSWSLTFLSFSWSTIVLVVFSLLVLELVAAVGGGCKVCCFKASDFLALSIERSRFSSDVISELRPLLFIRGVDELDLGLGVAVDVVGVLLREFDEEEEVVVVVGLGFDDVDSLAAESALFCC